MHQYHFTFKKLSFIQERKNVFLTEIIKKKILNHFEWPQTEGDKGNQGS